MKESTVYKIGDRVVVKIKEEGVSVCNPYFFGTLIKQTEDGFVFRADNEGQDTIKTEDIVGYGINMEHRHSIPSFQVNKYLTDPSQYILPPETLEDAQIPELHKFNNEVGKCIRRARNYLPDNVLAKEFEKILKEVIEQNPI